VNGREFDRFANALSSMGVDISVDDFGTGYSSLSRLVNLPINSFKIDRSFLAGIGVGHEKSEALLAGVSALASGLGLVTIVEGIETHEQLNWLRANGFSCGQGYLFSRPISLPAAIDYVEALPQRSTAMRPTPTSSSLIPAWRWLRGLKRQLFSQPTQRR
jgi:EAL domain-containing protein (putative c-di-GMP-specific phosphodiesterase class I)